MHIPRVREMRDEAQAEKLEFEWAGIQSLICVPMICMNKPVGFLGFDSVRKEKIWPEDIIVLLKIIGEVFANALVRKRAEEEMKSSEEKFRTLADNSPNMIFINKKGRIVYVNRLCTEQMGYSKQELTSPDFDFLHLIAPESRDLARSNFQKHSHGNDFPAYEYALVAKDEKRIEALISSKLISYEGETAILGVVTDITKRKQAEKAQAVIYRVAEDARRAETLDELYLAIHTFISELMTAKENFYLAILNESTGMIEFPYFVDECEEKPGPYKPRKGLTEYVLRTGKPLLATPEVFNNLEKKKEIEKVGPPPIDWLGVPLKTKGKTFGVLAVQSYKEGVRFSEEDKNTLMYLSGQIAQAIDRKKAEENLKSSRDELRNLAAHLQSVREEERKFMAREIHDDLGQPLAALKMDLTWLKNKISQDLLNEKTTSIISLVDKIIKNVKRISREMRPSLLDELGLAAALEWQAEEFQDRTGIRCFVSTTPGSFRLDRQKATALFRIFQEALSNADRHAQADRIDITLKEEAGHLKLEVQDNGKGISKDKLTSPDSFGIIGMRERTNFMQGELEINGRKAKGTRVCVRIPLKK